MGKVADGGNAERSWFNVVGDENARISSVECVGLQSQRGPPNMTVQE